MKKVHTILCAFTPELVRKIRKPPTNKQLSLDELWELTRANQRAVRCGQAAGLPEAARRYLEHAIAPGTPLATVVRLRMRGKIKLKRWLPFRAEEVIYWDR